MSAETINQPKTEHEATREHLSKEEVDKAFADIAFILALETSIADDDPIWDELLAPKESPADYETKFTFDKTYHRSAAADMFGLLNYAYSPKNFRMKVGDTPGQPHVNAHPRMFGGGYVNPQFDDNPYLADLNALRAYTNKPAPAPKSEFTPAPSLAAEPLGPQLPSLTFNDRVRPTSSRPSEADFKTADRANEMYQRALFDTGWRGGEATPEQAKSAGRAMAREYHPDLGASPADAEALKAFNASNAKPTTPAQK